MVYLNNDNNKQDVYIPRNDGQGSYVSKYDQGFADGINYQKGKITSITITENGIYENEDGYSPVIVDVDCQECPEPSLQTKTVVVTADTETITPDAGYDGFGEVNIDASQYGSDKYDEGYGDGEDDQKARLSSATFVENGHYELENGWSAVTVQTTCPPCPSPNLENKTVELESGTTLPTTITPSSGYDGFGEVTIEDNGYGDKKYDDGFSDGQDDIRNNMSSTAFTQNGNYSNSSGWSAVTVNVPTSGGSCSLQSKSVTLTAATETFYPDGGSLDITGIQTDGYCWFDTGIYPDFDTKIEVEFTPLDRSFITDINQKNWGGIIGAQNEDDDNATFQIRYSAGTSSIIGRVGDGGNTSLVNLTYGNRYVASLDKDYFMVNGSRLATNATYEDVCNYTIYVCAINNGVNHHTWVNHRATPNIIHKVSIWKNDALVCELIPAVNNGTPCLYDTIRQSYVYNIGTGNCTAISQGQAGYDGLSAITVDATDLCQDYYSSGYTDGQSNCPSCDTVSDFKTIVTGTNETVCVGFSRPSAPSGETVYGGSYAELKSLIDNYGNIVIFSFDDQAHSDTTEEGYFTYRNDQYIYYNYQGDITFPLDEIGPSWTNTGNNDKFFLWGDGMNIFFYTKYEYGWNTNIQDLTPNDLILELAEGDAAECIHIDSSEVYESGRQAGFDDGYADGQSNCPAPNLESVTVPLNSGWTGFTQVYPSSGYDGISDVTISDVGFGDMKYKSGYTAGQTDLSLLLYVTSDAATADTGTVSATTFEDLGGSLGVLREPISITENENMYMYKEPQHHTPENYEYGCIKFDKPLGRIQYFNFASADKSRVTEILLPDTMMVFLGPWETGYFRGLYNVFGDMPQLQKVRFPSLLKNIFGFNTCPMLESVVIPRTCSVVHAAFGQTGIKEIEFPPCTTYWENNTLRCSAVEKLIIRGGGYIGKGFCSGRSYSGFTGTDFTPALSEIYCYSTNPPVFNENNTAISPSDTDAPFADQKQNGTLYVPTGYANAYADWLNFLPSGWTISATL